MDVVSILIAAGVVSIVGILAGILLGIASEEFKVEVDEKEVAVRELLPGNNCGGCGYPGCDGLAAAIAQGKAAPGACPVGGEETGKKIAEIVGGDASVIKMTAMVKCAGDCNKAKEAYEYTGPKDCNIAFNTPGNGYKACQYGCMGFGSCRKVCEFNAIEIMDGIAVVDKEKCKACGKCVTACPKKLIELIPYKAEAFVQCNSEDFGKDVKEVCAAGCIGCGICQKNCPKQAITVDNHIAHIDYDKCTGCGICKEKCPVKIIK